MPLKHARTHAAVTGVRGSSWKQVDQTPPTWSPDQADEAAAAVAKQQCSKSVIQQLQLSFSVYASCHESG